MRVLFFGTFDEDMHPRVKALREGIAAHGHDVSALNAPLGIGTSERVRMAQRPWRAPILAVRLLRCWSRLWRAGASLRPDVVVVGYLGHFDVHLARHRFRDATIVLDHMVSLGDTARDRGLRASGVTARLLDAVDRAALRAADIVVVDTAAQGDSLPIHPARLCVIPVAPPAAWFQATPAPAPAPEAPVRVVFFGLFTPLQGAPVLGAALGALAGVPCEVTMIGSGQDLAEARELAAANPRVRWIDWVDADRLPDEVARHHVCLGIFGTTPKAARVVPNKVLQGAAAGCAVVTSDTPAQRAALGDAARFVRAGSPLDVVDAVTDLVNDREALAELRRRCRATALARFTPEATVEPLLAILGDHGPSARMQP